VSRATAAGSLSVVFNCLSAAAEGVGRQWCDAPLCCGALSVERAWPHAYVFWVMGLATGLVGGLGWLLPLGGGGATVCFWGGSNHGKAPSGLGVLQVMSFQSGCGLKWWGPLWRGVRGEGGKYLTKGIKRPGLHYCR
jgi:hypothetical protein